MAGDRGGLAGAQRVGPMRRIQSSNSRRTSAVSKSLDLGAPSRIMSDSGTAGLAQVGRVVGQREKSGSVLRRLQGLCS
jgi:hypothetical protein